jgi:hypothetical protein
MAREGVAHWQRRKRGGLGLPGYPRNMLPRDECEELRAGGIGLRYGLRELVRHVNLSEADVTSSLRAQREQSAFWSDLATYTLATHRALLQTIEIAAAERKFARCTLEAAKKAGWVVRKVPITTNVGSGAPARPVWSTSEYRCRDETVCASACARAGGHVSQACATCVEQTCVRCLDATCTKTTS